MSAAATVCLCTLLLNGQASVDGIAGQTVTLVKNGEPTAVLILPSSPHADEEVAARELQTHIETMSGARIEIRREGDRGGLVPVRIGLSLTPAAAGQIRSKSADPAAFLVSVQPGAVVLAGNSPEGTLFAAYQLLDQLGCRWYLPGDLGAVIPRKQTVSVPVGDVIQAPSFPHRHLQTVSNRLPWYRRQRLGGLEFPSCHGIPLLPNADFNTEPELFSLVNGKRTDQQLCVSNPEVVRRAIAATLDYFEKNPDTPWMGMGPNDGSGFCECEHCRSLDSGEWDPFSAEPAVTDRYVWFFNRVLEGIRDRFPDKKIGFYAYHTYMLPPQKEKPDPHIVPAFAPIHFCRLHGMSNPICPDRSLYRTLIVEWGKLVPEMFERGYYFNLACPGFPFSKVHAVRDETVVAHGAGIKGWRVECMPAWASHGLTLYVAARLMWDVNTNVDALLAEFYEKFFGLAAEPMAEYLTMIDTAYRDTDCHVGSSFCMPAVFTRERMSHGKNCLQKAALLAAGDDTCAERVHIFRLSYDHLEAFLDMIEARNRFDFVSARQALDRVRNITETMINYRLYPSGPVERKAADEDRTSYYHEARLLWPGAARSYLGRFWSPCTESGYDRTVVRGEFVAGAPDEWDFLIDPAGVGELLGWFRDGPLGGNWQKLRTKTAAWSQQGLHYYKGVAWYRTPITIPPQFHGRKILVWFGGVDEKAKVWLNGKPLDESDKPMPGLPGAAGCFEPFDLEATEAVRFDEPNFLAVKITNLELNEVGTGGITAPVMFWTPK